MKNTFFLIGTITILSMSACATGRTERFLDSQLGKMTYNEALQCFGKPTECRKDGDTTRCNWVYWQCGGKFFRSGGAMRKTYRAEPPVATLTFEKKTLAEWRLEGTWK